MTTAVGAAVPAPAERTYIAARAASMSGDHARSAQLLATLAQSEPRDLSLARRAVGEAISAGDMATALSLSRRQPVAALPVDARLLLIADALRRGRHGDALPLTVGTGAGSDLSFLKPMINAWGAAEGRNEAEAMHLIGELSSSSLLGPFANEQRALLLLKLKRTAAAEPYATNALESAGGREQRLRMAFADGYLAAGDKARALANLDGEGTELARARNRIRAGRDNGQAIDTGAKAFSEYLLSLAIELTRASRQALPISLAQVARYAAPDNGSAAILLGVLLERSDRTDEAIAAFRSVRPDSGFADQALDSESQALIDSKRFTEALARASAAAAVRDADVSDLARLGDAYSAMKRHPEAAAA
jgi:hypothetical protein